MKAEKPFTAIGVRSYRARDQRLEIVEPGGLRLIVYALPSNRKSWAYRYKKPGVRDSAKIIFGSPETMSLAQARVALANAKLELSRGIDPAAAKRQAKVEAEIADITTLRSIAESHLRYEEGKPIGKRLRTIDQRRAVFERAIYSVLGARPISEIKRGEIIKLLDEVEAERGGRAADEVLSVLRIVFDWHAVRDEDFRSPIVKGMARTTAKERIRTRVLDDGELRAVWLASEGEGVFGALVKFLLLTATRRNEAAHMRWSEVKNGVWTIPAERFKSEREHVIPLSKAAIELLEKQPRIMGCDFVFTNDGQRAIAGFSRYKAKLDKASGVTGWRIHDTRRVARSLLSRAGIANDIAEMCLGHTLGGLRATYDQHRYEAEKRHAFESLAQQIERIVYPPEGNVVQLRG